MPYQREKKRKEPHQKQKQKQSQSSKNVININVGGKGGGGGGTKKRRTGGKGGGGGGGGGGGPMDALAYNQALAMSAPHTNYVPITNTNPVQNQDPVVVQPQVVQQDNKPSFWDMLQQSIGFGIAGRLGGGGGSTTNIYHNEPERPPPATERAVVDRSRGGLPNQPPVRQPPANRTRLQELQAEQAARRAQQPHVQPAPQRNAEQFQQHLQQQPIDRSGWHMVNGQIIPPMRRSSPNPRNAPAAPAPQPAAAAARRAPQGANSPIPQQAGQAQVPRTIAAAPQLDDEKKMLDELRHAKKTDYDKMFGRNGHLERLNFINTTGAHKERAVPFTEHSTVNNAIIYDPDEESRFGSFFTPALIHIETGEHKFIDRGDILSIKRKADQNRKLLDSTPARNPPGIFGRSNDKRDYGTPGEEKKQPAVNSPEETPRTSIKNFIDANKKPITKEQVLAPTAKPPQQASDMELTPNRSVIKKYNVSPANKAMVDDLFGNYLKPSTIQPFEVDSTKTAKKFVGENKMVSEGMGYLEGLGPKESRIGRQRVQNQRPEGQQPEGQTPVSAVQQRTRDVIRQIQHLVSEAQLIKTK